MQNMASKKRIAGTRAYSYKGYTIAGYLGGSKQTTVKWLVELDGREVAGDINTLTVAQNWVDNHPIRRT